MNEIFQNLYEMTAFSNIIAEPQFLIMYAIAFVLLYLGIKKQYEPLLLVPIAFGVLLANFPGGDMGVIQADENGLINVHGVMRNIWEMPLHGIAHGLNEFCRLDVSGTALDTGKAAQAGVDALRGKQLLNSAVFDHGDKLMRMVFHLVIRRTARRAFAAAHTLSGVYAGNAGDGFNHVLVVHASSSPQPSASARSSVK